MTEYELDADTALTRVEDGLFEGTLTGRWNVGAGMNGGYLAAFYVRAVTMASDLPDPLSMTLHYLARPAAGLATVRVDAVRVGRGHATYRVDLVQDGVTIVAGLCLTGRHRGAGELDFSPPAPFSRGPDDSLAFGRVGGETMSLLSRLEQRVENLDDVFFLRSQPGPAQSGGWGRLADGRPADALSVALFLDSWPPAVFSRTMRPDPAGAPTLELTIHWRRRAGTGWHFARFQSRLLDGGYADEGGELWSEDGLLVAESRQLARYS